VLAGGLFALVLALHRPESASAAFNDSDGDGALDVAERIAGSDPNDAASYPESAGGGIYLGQPLCTDGVDNDLDGMTDAADPGCTDSDGDLVDDPVEVALGSDPNNNESIPEDSLLDAVLASLGFIEFQCNDELDNDLDGMIDAADPGCEPLDTDSDGFDDATEKTYGSDPDDAASQPENVALDAATCADDVDNDLDGLTDGADDGCLPEPTATPTTPAAATAAATATPAATVAALPATGGGAGDDAGEARLLLALAAFGGAVLGALGVRRASRGRRVR
jgi:hypothetical protein